MAASSTPLYRDEIIPHDHDIKCGRGKGPRCHPGNVFLRETILQFQQSYRATGYHFVKGLIAKSIMNIIENRDPPGRFIEEKHDNRRGTFYWTVVSKDMAMKKVKQALRDSLKWDSNDIDGDNISTVNGLIDPEILSVLRVGIRNAEDGHRLNQLISMQSKKREDREAPAHRTDAGAMANETSGMNERSAKTGVEDILDRNGANDDLSSYEYARVASLQPESERDRRQSGLLGANSIASSLPIRENLLMELDQTRRSVADLQSRSVASPGTASYPEFHSQVNEGVQPFVDYIQLNTTRPIDLLHQQINAGRRVLPPSHHLHHHHLQDGRMSSASLNEYSSRLPLSLNINDTYRHEPGYNTNLSSLVDRMIPRPLNGSEDTRSAQRFGGFGNESRQHMLPRKRELEEDLNRFSNIKMTKQEETIRGANRQSSFPSSLARLREYDSRTMMNPTSKQSSEAPSKTSYQSRFVIDSGRANLRQRESANVQELQAQSLRVSTSSSQSNHQGKHHHVLDKSTIGGISKKDKLLMRKGHASKIQSTATAAAPSSPTDPTISRTAGIVETVVSANRSRLNESKASGDKKAEDSQPYDTSQKPSIPPPSLDSLQQTQDERSSAVEHSNDIDQRIMFYLTNMKNTGNQCKEDQSGAQK